MAARLFDTAIGPCGFAFDAERGLVRVALPEASLEATRARLGEEPSPSRAPAWVARLEKALVAHLAGAPQDMRFAPLDPSCTTAFRAKVYEALRGVPAGRTITYGALAREAGSPLGARAVGVAMAKNPWPVVVPCHRVLADGKPGGFSAYGGLVTKEKLLALEGVALAPQTSLFDGPTKLPYDASKAVRALAAADPVLGRHMAAVGPFALRVNDGDSTFAVLAESIVYQQLATKAAATIHGRFCALFPSRRPSPERLIALDDATLRAAGLSANKAKSIQDLAARCLRGEVPELDRLATMDDEAAVEALTPVRGVGRWTVEMLLIFRLGRPDVLPLGDYGVRKGFAKVFLRGAAREEAAPVAELERRGERWRPYRSVASWYLWRALS